ncbi:MAG: ParB/RepB/Spo0J family partition protein [Oscillospiraceae bacterium]|nr:ParB/RepB/Spo0J family partition protein [Oscillospiraceae bacterium]
MKKHGSVNLGLTGYDELFMTYEERVENRLPKIYDLPLSEIDPFPDHPFKVRMDEDMELLVQSVKERGVITPITVREKDDGRYEIISGHRRKRACELAGLETVRAEIKELTRDEAIIMMTESNFQRSVILPSEKAFAYKMRLEAMNRQGERTDLTFSPSEKKLRSGMEMADSTGDSQAQIYRYIRLTNLITELLDLVDEGRIGLRPAVELSYLPQELQRNVSDAISITDATPSHDQAIRMRRQYDQGTLNRDAIVAIMTEAKPNQRNQLRFSKEDFGSYFPAGYTPAQMKRDILKGLELLQRERRRERDGR